jgi:hypothetical protein
VIKVAIVRRRAVLGKYRSEWHKKKNDIVIYQEEVRERNNRLPKPKFE